MSAVPDAVDSGAGFFGKVMSHGDFVSRRLPPAMLAVWDAWLQAGMQASRGQLGAAWLDTYLTSPIWRFALAPGVCDNQSWAGVLMPSVDRVGRHFPLTIATGVPGGGALLDWLGEGKDWFDRLEDLALSSLEDAFVLDNFDAALQALAPLPDREAPMRGGPSGYHMEIGALDALPAQLPALATAALRGHSLWWTDGSSEVAPSLLLCRGLPAPAAFGGMLAGNWPQSGWAPSTT